MKHVRRLLLTMVLAVMMLIPAQTAFAGLRVPAIKPGEVLQPVKTLAWQGKLLRNVNTKYGSYPAGTEVTIIKGGGSCIIKLDGHNYKISRQYLTFEKDLATVVDDGDYNRTTKDSFANDYRRKSKTQYFVWVSLDKQRINIYKGKNRNWTLIKVFKCTTGADNSTPMGNFTIRRKMHSFTGQYGSPLYFYMEFAGSGFHRWPGGGIETIGTHTQSHGCIRMVQKDAIWMYKKVPIGSKVLIY